MMNKRKNFKIWFSVRYFSHEVQRQIFIPASRVSLFPQRGSFSCFVPSLRQAIFSYLLTQTPFHGGSLERSFVKAHQPVGTSAESKSREGGLAEDLSMKHKTSLLSTFQVERESIGVVQTMHPVSKLQIITFTVFPQLLETKTKKWRKTQPY